MTTILSNDSSSDLPNTVYILLSTEENTKRLQDWKVTPADPQL
jgi:hypothetical protein